MVDKSLSRGLADRVLDEVIRLSATYGEQAGFTLRGIPRKRHAVRDKAQALVAAGERACLAQVLSNHPKWRWASICALVPYVRKEDGSSGRSIAFLPLRACVQVDRGVLLDHPEAAVLTVSEHAVERLFQRLDVLEPAAVREELHDATFMAIPLRNAAVMAGLKQVVLPTRSGAFLCSVEEGSLVARTWIAHPDRPCRHMEPARMAREAFDAAGGELGLGAAIGELPMLAPLSMIEPPGGLAESLGRVAWLREPYVRRADPVGDTWKNARAQQHLQLAAA